MSAIIREPHYFDRTETWMRGKWKPEDFKPAASRCYGTEPQPRNYFMGVCPGAWVRYRGRVWQVWSHHRIGGLVWLANGETYMSAEVTACEVLAQAQDEDVPLLGEESVA